MLSVLEPLCPQVRCWPEERRQRNVTHFLTLFIEDVVILEKGQSITCSSLEELRVHLLHQLRARRHILLVQEDTLRLLPDLLVLYLPLQIYHVALLCKVIHSFF